MDTTAYDMTLPLPAGARDADNWPSVRWDGVPARSVIWATWDIREFCVSVWGIQYGDGRVDGPDISVFGPSSSIDDVTADDARHLAVKLLIAADELERLQ